jgi:hypothetical protein
VEAEGKAEALKIGTSEPIDAPISHSLARCHMRKSDSYGRFRVVAVVFLLFLGAAATSQAQVVARSFDELRLKVAPGDAIYVTEADGRERRARVLELSPSALVLAVGSVDRRFTEEDVRQIRKRTPDSLWTGGLIGAGVGAALGALAVSFSEDCSYRSSSCAGPLLSMTAMAAGIGIGIDALIQGRKVIYERSPRSPSRVSVVPVISPGKAAAVVVIRR